MPDWVGITVGLLAAALVGGILLRTVGGRPAKDQGMLSFRLPISIGVIGFLSVTISVFMAAGVVVGVNEEQVGILVLFAMFSGLMGWIGWMLVRDTFLYRLLCNEEVVLLFIGNKLVGSYRWNELTKGKVNLISRYIFLYTADGRGIRVSPWLKGSNQLFDIIERRTQIRIRRLVAQARAF